MDRRRPALGPGGPTLKRPGGVRRDVGPAWPQSRVGDRLCRAAGHRLERSEGWGRHAIPVDVQQRRAEGRQSAQHCVAVPSGADQPRLAQHGGLLACRGRGDAQCPGQFGGRAPDRDGPDRFGSSPAK